MENKNTILDSAVEIGTSLLVGYAISRFVKIGIARGESMLPTIKNNQPFLIDRRAYKRREPKRHDLVAFKAHQKNKHKIFLKRVIGIPGDWIEIKEGQLYINDEKLEEPYIKEPMLNPWKRKIKVKQGTLFVMGDNRNNSLDSRSRSLGLVSIEKDVVGVVRKVIF